MPKNYYRLAVGVSGSGTTFEAIARAIKQRDLRLNLLFVFADRECGAIEKANKLGIPVIKRNDSETIEEFHKRIVLNLKKKEIDFVALAGYLRLFPIKKDDPYLVLNSHPARIPEFGGEGMWGHHVHKAVVEHAKKTDYKYPYTFSTIHIASDEYDRGPVVGIKELKISKGDTPEEVAAKLLPLEHQNYIGVLKRLSEKVIDYPEYPKKLR
jgi:phosphoribosylglycinamide formyltransferase-1